MSCPICGYHPGWGPPAQQQRSCPRVHIYRPAAPHRADCRCSACPIPRDQEVPVSAYDPDSPEPEPREKCSHCDGTGLARSWSAETRGDVCTWCWGGGDAA